MSSRRDINGSNENRIARNAEHRLSAESLYSMYNEYKLAGFSAEIALTLVSENMWMAHDFAKFQYAIDKDEKE